MTRRVLLGLLVATAACRALPAADPLPSWSDGPAKRAIVEYVERVTTTGGADYVPPRDRIATFDNDGTLWTEKPTYVQAFFLLQRVEELAVKHPEWRERQPFRAVLEKDREALATLGVPELMELVLATHAGLTEAEFARLAGAWLVEARHPRFRRPYTQLVYQPMLELMALLRAKGFQVWICTGGGQGFVRLFAERVYGVAPERVIGSSLLTKFERDEAGVLSLVRQPKLVEPLNDKPGKPVTIQRHIGKRPLVAVGNSDGDIEMLQWARAPALRVLVHHDDAEREYSYTHGTERALQLAAKEKWTVVRIKRDFRTVYPEPAKR